MSAASSSADAAVSYRNVDETTAYKKGQMGIVNFPIFSAHWWANHTDIRTMQQLIDGGDDDADDDDEDDVDDDKADEGDDGDEGKGASSPRKRKGGTKDIKSIAEKVDRRDGGIIMLGGGGGKKGSGIESGIVSPPHRRRIASSPSPSPLCCAHVLDVLQRALARRQRRSKHERGAGSHSRYGRSIRSPLQAELIDRLRSARSLTSLCYCARSWLLGQQR